MSLVGAKTPQPLAKDKDPLEIDGDVQIKQEVEELDDSEANFTDVNNEVVIKKEVADFDLNSTVNCATSSGGQRIKNVNHSTSSKRKIVKILPVTKQTQSRKVDPGLNSKTLKTKKEGSCNCMQNIEYYCYKCDKTLQNIHGVKQCIVCNNQLKLQCRICHRRYKLLKSVQQLNIVPNVKKEIDIKEEDHFFCFKCNFKTTEKSLFDDHIIQDKHEPDISFGDASNTVPNPRNGEVLFCYKCEFSTKDKEILNSHILKLHWQPQSDFKLNSDDDMYIELLCKLCQKICRKVTYDSTVKLVCRECQIAMLYRCTLCRTGYKLLKNVRYHVKCVCPYRTNNEKFYCADCTFKTETKKRLENHIIKKHLNQQCLNCNKIFEDNDALRQHVLEECTIKKDNADPAKLELPTKDLTADDDKFVVLQYNPQILLKNVYGKPPKDTKEWRTLIDYLCLECGDVAKKKFARYRPWCRKCNLKYDYRCISCEKLYGNYDRIHYHVTVGCPNRKLFECPLCKFSVSKKSFLFNHVQNKHTIYKCMDCFTNFEGFGAMKSHDTIDCRKDLPITAEQLEKLIILYCKHCFRRPRNIVNATKTRCEKCTNILSFQCLRCFQIFLSRNNAYKHIKESCKPNFSCEKCTFKTYTQDGLDTHIKYKHMIRTCPDCGVNFKDEVIFQLHRREEIRRKTQENFSDDFPVTPPKRFKAA